MELLESKERFVSKKVTFINNMLINRFKAISIDKNDSRIAHLLNDPYIPNFKEIYRVYCIYRKSILVFSKTNIALLILMNLIKLYYRIKLFVLKILKMS